MYVELVNIIPELLFYVKGYAKKVETSARPATSPTRSTSIFARSMPSILPNLTLEEALEVTRIYSVNDMLPADEPRVRQRPLRAPHHTILHAGLVGGGRWPRALESIFGTKTRTRLAAPGLIDDA